MDLKDMILVMENYKGTEESTEKGWNTIIETAAWGYADD